MLTKEECLKALDFIEEETTYVEDYETMPLITCNHLQKEIAILRQLINEHFEHFDNSNNSADFNHFKLHADSTLKTFKKDELIDYIHMLYHNWQSTDRVYNNTVKMNYKLQNEIDELKSNPPLKIEEIKKGMWVWDNKYECYAKIFAINEYKGTTYIDFNDYYSERYAENRFYRKQVEE